MKNKDLTKEIILKAKDIIDANGTKFLSMRKLATSLDIAVGTLYNYYPNKQSVLAKVMEVYWMQFYKSSMEQAKNNQSIDEELTWFIDQCQDFSLRYQDAWFIEKDDTEKGWQQYVQKMVCDILDRHYPNRDTSLNNATVASIIINSAFTMSTIGLTSKEDVITIVKNLK